MTHRQAALVTLAGGVFMIIGAMLPWLSARSALVQQSVSGIDGSDGVIALALGALIALTAVLHLDQGGVGTRAAAVGFGILGVGIAFISINWASGRVASVISDSMTASVGTGLYVLLIGAGAAILGGWHMGKQ